MMPIADFSPAQFSRDTSANLQRVMTEKNISRESVVDHLNLTPQQAQGLWSGNDVGVATLDRAAQMLGLRGHDLLPPSPI
jgi:transcriptional regulator with XRE-family HTH domain